MTAKGFPLGVVEFTTLMKGALAAGDLAEATKILNRMLEQSPAVYPDIRTVNTYLRGCLKLGELQEAFAFYSRLEEWGVFPDAATYKIMVHSYGQAFKLKDMLRLVKELQSQNMSSNALEGLDNAVDLNHCTAEVACLLGQQKIGLKALSRAEAALAEESSAQSQFDKLRRQELTREVKKLRKSLSDGSDEDFDLIGALQKTFAFPSKRKSSLCTHEQVFASMKNGFGIEECFRRGFCSEEDFKKHLQRCFRSDGRFRWPRVFGKTDLPTKLEVCSGTGDWIVAQAKAEAGEANWVASELRYDRVQSILTKMVLARVGNCGLLAGDAGSIVKESIPEATLSNVFVNFPEPPQTTRNASCDEAESELHLLTPSFFEDVHTTLIAGGILTIFSDNQEYTRFLAKTVGSLRKTNGERMFQPLADVPMEHIETAEECCGMLMCTGTPGVEAGHAVQAASQFDRFFQHGQHTERYYVAAVKH
eukprot:TRINITY_DN12835_c1_g1_i1.p1 TRINITY_DN12835_c1_g1~~TRINITY_DN12835_c1_g1_i1.p1  ORF type:complete len:513 (-),score=92.14 TRINITY_DN12835_c1_g1_i1:105-1535(-)